MSVFSLVPHLNPAFCPSGTKRKSERSDSQDLKRLRPSSRQAPSRSSSSNKRTSGPPLSSSKKTVSSPRGRHATATNYSHEYYDERKGHRGGREATRSRGGEDLRGRESQRGMESLNQVPLIVLHGLMVSLFQISALPYH